VKLRNLIKHLETHSCLFLRQGGNHTVYKNLDNGKMTTVPRHREVKENLVKKICDDLGIEQPSKKQ